MTPLNDASDVKFVNTRLAMRTYDNQNSNTGTRNRLTNYKDWWLDGNLTMTGGRGGEKGRDKGDLNIVDFTPNHIC